MFNTDVLWNKALTDNNVGVISRWLRSLTTEGQHDADKCLAKYNCWLRCSIEMTRKELLTLCFGQCYDLWIFLDRTSFSELSLLIQKLKNLLFLARRGHTCAQCECWNQDVHTLRQHILLGRLVQWLRFSGLLPQYPGANELKQISQMWQEMNQQHRITRLQTKFDMENKCRGSPIIHAIVAHMHKQYGLLRVSEDCTNWTYPPPSLQSLLKLVLVPYTDTAYKTSALAIIMYFILDVSNIQCKGNLMESFCHTFCIPSSFSQQIYGLWLQDHGFVSNSVGKLLSPGISSAWLSCHSYAVLRTLLREGQRQAALKYLYNIKPAIENTQDAKLHVRNLLKRCQPGNEYPLKHFICGCENSKLLSSNILQLDLSGTQNSRKPDSISRIELGEKVVEKKTVVKEHAPIPLSALIYQCLFNGSLTPGDFLRLFREAVTELNSSATFIRMMVDWPKYLRKSKENWTALHLPETCCELPISPNHVELQKEEAGLELLQYDRVEVHISPTFFSSGPTSPDHMDSAGSSVCSSAVPHAEGRQEETNDEDFNMPSDIHMSCKDVTQCSSHITITVDVPKSVPIKSLCKVSIDELVISEDGIRNNLTCAGNLPDPTESHIMEVAQIENSIKDKQSMLHNTAMIHVTGDDNYFIPDYEKAIDNMIQEPHSESVNTEDENEQFSVLSSESDISQDTMCEEAFGSNSFLNLKPLRRALPYPPVEKSLRFFCYDPQDAMDQPEILTSCAHTEIMQDLLKQFSEQNLSMKDEDLTPPSFLASIRSSILITDLNPVRRGSRPHQLQISLGAPLLPVSHAEKTKDKASIEGKNSGVKEVVCFRTTSERMGDCKLGNWWKQALETRRASTGLLPAIEQVPAVTKEKRHSLVLGWPQCHGILRGCKQEVKQATMEESSSRKAKGKRGKRVKQC